MREAFKLVCCARSLLLVMVFTVLYVPFLLNYGWDYRDIPSIDLPSFYSASAGVFRFGESPYERERLQSYMETQIHVYPYLYPPPSLLFFYPFSELDYTTARYIVLAANHLIILALLWVIPWFLLSDLSKPWPWKWSCRPERGTSLAFALTFAYLLTFHPTIETLKHGQVNFLLLALLLAFWIIARAGKPVLASLFLALAVVLKTYPLLVVPMLFLTGRRRECAYTSAWLGLGVGISLLILPSAIWHDWFVNVFPTGGYGHAPVGLFSPAAIWNQSLNGFFARAFTESQWSSPLLVNEDLARSLTYAAAALVAGTSVLAVWRCSRVRSGDLDRTMLVALPAMYLLAPFSWEHHLVYLLPSILMLLTSRARLRTGSTILYYAMSAGSAVLIGMNGLLTYKVFGVFVLWVLSILVACNRGIQLPNEVMERSEQQY